MARKRKALKIPKTIRQTLDGIADKEWDEQMAAHISDGKAALNFLQMIVDSLKEARFYHLQRMASKAKAKRKLRA